MSTDMDIFMDMMSDQESRFAEIVEDKKDESYYQGLGIHIREQFTNNENYFHFLKSILTDFRKLTSEQQDILKEIMHIQPETIIQEKIIIQKEKVKKMGTKEKKPKLNTYDDY